MCTSGFISSMVPGFPCFSKLPSKSAHSFNSPLFKPFGNAFEQKNTPAENRLWQ